AIAAFALSARVAATPLRRQSSGISWFQCPDHDKTQCAFFDVPRDYSNPDENDTVSIFMRKLPANVSDENRLGTILTNPGGPGGSGSAYIAEGGERLRTIVDGRYDIIGFDPRAVNLTSPWTACFDYEAKPVLMGVQQEYAGAPYPHSSLEQDRAVVNKLRSIQAAHPAACLANGNRKMLEASSTALVVQDMARMVEALGEDGINYWGYSYGTILGATFAAMRPDLVRRMVLDGVSNSQSYYNDALQWGKDGTAATHKTYTGFLSTCADAGPDLCAFAVPPGNSTEKQTTETLRRRVDAIYTRLGQQPQVVADSLVGPGIITGSNVQAWILGMLYTPIAWPGAMQDLANLEKGNGTGIYTALYSPLATIDSIPYDQNVFNRSMQRFMTRESLAPIACSDLPAFNLSTNAYTDYIREMGKISPVSEQLARLIGTCSGWPFRSSQRYTGPWTVEKGFKKTKFPVLFASLDADPVTPLSSAVTMSRGFGKESAALLVQQGFGHCTIAHPSLCTIKHIHDYFVEGKVPANGTHCTPEPGYIYPTNSTSSKRAMSGLDKRDAELLEAMHRLREVRSKFDPDILGK
ncbi:hypothetical protein FRC09_016754, partial [Ceratobasidium sp. 395]